MNALSQHVTLSSTDLLQLVGTGFIALFGLILYRIAVGTWERRYTSEALLCAAAFQGTSVVVRLAVIFDYLGQTMGRTVNGFVALGFVTILVQIAIMGRMHEAEQRKRTGGTRDHHPHVHSRGV